MSLLLIILGVLLVVALFGGGWGYSRYGYGAWSPLLLVLVILLILWLTGNLALR